jgi:Rps23 Pro-64 3,4-dihydroxylase Tpa1-like proline 4-hydroxylase
MGSSKNVQHSLRIATNILTKIHCENDSITLRSTTAIHHETISENIMSELTSSRILRDIDIDQLASEFQSQKPFPSICIDNFLNIDFANDVADSYPSYLEAQKMGRGFHAVNERGKYQITDASVFPGPIKQLHATLASDEFLGMMSKMAGIDGLVADQELVGGGIHQTGPRGHLDVHVDFNYIVERKLHRRLNILLFFNRDWQDEWGGQLELWDKDVKVCHHKFSPIFNRCCVFQTSEISFHGVSAVKCPEDVARRSFAAYYYTPETDERMMKNVHSTVFRARPDEHLKRNVLMPLEHLGRLLKRGKQALGRKVKGK